MCGLVMVLGKVIYFESTVVELLEYGGVGALRTKVFTIQI